MEPTNTVVYYFESAPYFTYARTICPRCQTPYTMFIRGYFKEMMEHFILHDFPFITEDYPPETLVHGFEEVYQVKELPEHALTTRLDNEVKHLGEILETIPDDLLWAELTDPEQPHKLPESWL